MTDQLFGEAWADEFPAVDTKRDIPKVGKAFALVGGGH